MQDDKQHQNQLSYSRKDYPYQGVSLLRILPCKIAH